MISAIIPTYRNPVYLDLCLRSATENQQNEDTEIIVIVDGYPQESEAVLAKYDGIRVLDLPQNMGMQYALNLGVMNATNKYVVILNDDNVLASRWDERIQKLIEGNDMTNVIITIDQVEPDEGSIYNFLSAEGAFKFIANKPPEYWKLWKSPDTFPYEAFMNWESVLKRAKESYLRTEDAGRIFPFIVSKRIYLMLGGFDTFYKSPFYCDLDWWLKADMAGMKFGRWYGMHWYHFGSAATKNRKDAEAEMFRQSEIGAMQSFKYKWGFCPNVFEARDYHNTKLPLHKRVINGIDFWEGLSLMEGLPFMQEKTDVQD
jgi:glycosyltransferase involved in cell wall biosynthesis